jgi:signal transduction histidine kinase
VAPDNGRLDMPDAELMRRVNAALAVHHDIRNALTGVLGNAQLLLMGPAAHSRQVRRRLESLIHEAERIRDLTDTLGQVRLELKARVGDARDASGEAAGGSAHGAAA